MDARSALREVKPISKYQFAAFHMVLGAYLVIHFAQLIPYAAELFSNSGVLPDARANFTYGLLPNPLALFTFPQAAITFVSLLAALSFCFMIGFQRRMAAVLLWYGMACLFNRNNLIANPSLPYIGLILLLTACVPDGEAACVGAERSDRPWLFPAWVFRTAWILMAAGYSLSGLDKLLFSPSWTDGTALVHVLNLPLARPGLLRHAILEMPPAFLSVATYGILALETFALPLSLFRRTRPWYWLAMAAMHLGIIFIIDFADLSIGMLMLHLFTFDPEWLPARAGRTSSLVLFDGACGMCNRTVQFLKTEDRAGVLAFAPRQSETAENLRHQFPRLGLDWDGADSVLYFRRDGGKALLLNRSSAVFAILSDIGGFWRVVSLMRIIPRGIRDFVYDSVASRRQSSKRAQACVLGNR